MTTRLAYNAAIDPCGHCGAWKWELDRGRTVGERSGFPILAADALRCGECNHPCDASAVEWITVGRDR